MTVTTIATATPNADAFGVSGGILLALNAAFARAEVGHDPLNLTPPATAQATLGSGNVTVGGAITISVTLTATAEADTDGVTVAGGVAGPRPPDAPRGGAAP